MAYSHSSVRCPGPIDRRSWLKIGGLSFGALATGLQPNLAQLLAEENAQPGKRSALDKDFSVILFWANGGPSHLELFDLKPDAPREYRGDFRPIETNVPVMEISEHLPKLATMADKFAIVRSLHHKRAEHSGGTHREAPRDEEPGRRSEDTQDGSQGEQAASHPTHRCRA